MNSETAYSKVKGQLDHSTKKQEALQRERKGLLLIVVVVLHTFLGSQLNPAALRSWL